MRASRAGESKQVEGSDVTHLMNPAAAVVVLCARHRGAEARKIALEEQRKAKRARSKKRFIFWGEVETQIGNGD
jgi:hypothetical protein